MSELQIERFALPDTDVLCIRLVGRNRIDDSLTNASKLSARLHREQRTGLIMDYRECALDHTVAQFSEVAEVFASEMPETLRIAYIYAPSNMMHALMMTKRLAGSGRPARAFTGWDEAETFARER